MTELADFLSQSAIVEQAKGVLAESHGLTPEEACGRLVQIATHSKLSLAVVAAGIVAAAGAAPAAV
jgi:AmiR/NasT family two-component response regulator